MQRTSSGCLILHSRSCTCLMKTSWTKAGPSAASCILRPNLYRSLHEEYPDGIPSDSTLRSNLVRRGFNPESIDGVIADFKSTMELAKVYDVSDHRIPFKHMQQYHPRFSRKHACSARSSRSRAPRRRYSSPPRSIVTTYAVSPQDARSRARHPPIITRQ